LDLKPQTEVFFFFIIFLAIYSNVLIHQPDIYFIFIIIIYQKDIGGIKLKIM